VELKLKFEEPKDPFIVKPYYPGWPSIEEWSEIAEENAPIESILTFEEDGSDPESWEFGIAIQRTDGSEIIVSRVRGFRPLDNANIQSNSR